MGRALPALLNVLKAWALLLGLCAGLGAIGWAINGYRLASVFVFCGILIGLAVYWSADRFGVGLLGGRELLQAEAPAIHSTVERLAAKAGVAKPKIYLIPQGLPIA